MAKTKSNLVETKGHFKLTGKVVGIDDDNASREGVTASDKLWKSIKFNIQTSPLNRIKVELFGMEKDVVYAYSRKDKKTKKVDFEDRHDSHGSYKVMGVGVELGANGKSTTLVEYDAVDYIKEHLTNGETVTIKGKVSYSTYTNQAGEVKEQVTYAIGNIKKVADVDFDAEDFKEVNAFDQEIVVTAVEKVENQLIINAKTIQYGGKHTDSQFVVDGKKYPKLAQNMKKRLKYGDFIKVLGLIVNVVEVENEGTSEEDEWGGEKPNGIEAVITHQIKEMQITSVDTESLDPKRYSEEDFFDEDEENFGNAGKNDSNDDFEDEDFDEDDDLPFE